MEFYDVELFIVLFSTIIGQCYFGFKNVSAEHKCVMIMYTIWYYLKRLVSLYLGHLMMKRFDVPVQLNGCV